VLRGSANAAEGAGSSSSSRVSSSTATLDPAVAADAAACFALWLGERQAAAG
jgi:hypothetical protein